jgi:hypothetical protein
MNYVENLKLTQLRKWFKIFSSICGAREGFLFEFASLSGVWKFERIFLLGRAHLSVARFHFDCPGWSPSPTHRLVPGGHAHRVESVSVLAAADRRRPTWVGPLIPVLGRHHRR